MIKTQFNLLNANFKNKKLKRSLIGKRDRDQRVTGLCFSKNNNKNLETLNLITTQDICTCSHDHI
jgi:hypothetical protein